MVWGLVAGAAAGLLSSTAGALQQRRQQQVLKDQYRRGIEQANVITSRVSLQAQASPESSAYRDFIRGVYGISPGAQGAGVGITNPLTDARGRLRLSGTELLSGKGGADLGAIVTDPRNRQAVGDIRTALGGIQDVMRARTLAGGGYALSEDEQSFVDKTLASENLQGVLKGLEGLSGGSAEVLGAALTQRGIGESEYSGVLQELLRAAGRDQPGPEGSYAGDLSASSVNPLARNFAKGLSQAQASRGLFGSNVSAAAEASGMAAYLFEQQKALLPNLQQLPYLNAQSYQGLFGGFANQQIAYNTAGQAGYGTTLNYGEAVNPITEGAAGLISGATSGFAIQKGIEDLNAQREKQQAQAGSATSGGLFGFLGSLLG